MIGLRSNIVSSSITSDNAPAPDISLPYEGNYIYLEDKFKITNPNSASSPVTIHAYNDISFDDSVVEVWNFEGNLANVYTENVSEALGNKYLPSGSVISSGDTVTITGRILRYDNNEVWDGDDTGNPPDGYIEFDLNGDANFRVYIDLQNTSSITSSHYDRVDSSGDFSVSKTLGSNVGRLNIIANYIADGGIMTPGVRISNLTMTKS